MNVAKWVISWGNKFESILCIIVHIWHIVHIQDIVHIVQNAQFDIFAMMYRFCTFPRFMIEHILNFRCSTERPKTIVSINDNPAMDFCIFHDSCIATTLQQICKVPFRIAADVDMLMTCTVSMYVPYSSYSAYRHILHLS